MGAEAEATIRSYRPGDEEGIVAVLNASHGGAWGTVDDWRWKHRDRPGFDPECISVAESGGRIVGCWHAALEDLRPGGAPARVAFEGDTAVDPGHRGGAIVLRLYDALNEALLSRGALLRVGLATPDLAERFYGGLFGFQRLALPTFTKALDSQPLKDAVGRLNGLLEKSGALRRDLRLAVQFDLRDMPPFALEVREGRLTLEDGRHPSPDIVIAGEQAPVLSALTRRARGGDPRALVRAVLTRRVRLRGVLTNSWTLLRLFGVLVRLRERG